MCCMSWYRVWEGQTICFGMWPHACNINVSIVIECFTKDVIRIPTSTLKKKKKKPEKQTKTNTSVNKIVLFKIL